jgi:Na+-transporting NADH:ubiquinone oxidoreductase subunit NqrF
MTSELPLILFAPLIFFSILYWMVGIGDATLYVIFVAVNLLYCLIIQVIVFIILFKKSLKIPKGQSEAVNRRIEDKQQSTKRYTENQRLKSKNPQKQFWSTSN